MDGIEQMIWNTLRTKKECSSYTYRSFNEIGGEKLAGRWQEEWMRKKLVFKELYSDEYLESIKQTNRERINQQSQPCFQSRYIPSSILDIQHQVDIYNDVVAYYNWHEGEIFGVE